MAYLRESQSHVPNQLWHRSRIAVWRFKWPYLFIVAVIVAKSLLLTHMLKTSGRYSFLGFLFLGWIVTMIGQVFVTITAFHAVEDGSSKVSALLVNTLKGASLLAGFYLIVLGFLLMLANDLVIIILMSFKMMTEPFHWSAAIVSLIFLMGIVIGTSLLAFVLPSVILDGSQNPFSVSFRYAKKNLSVLMPINLFWYLWIAASISVELWETKWERASKLGAGALSSSSFSALEKVRDWDHVIHALRIFFPTAGTVFWLFITVFMALLYRSHHGASVNEP